MRISAFVFFCFYLLLPFLHAQNYEINSLSNWEEETLNEETNSAQNLSFDFSDPEEESGLLEPMPLETKGSLNYKIVSKTEESFPEISDQDKKTRASFFEQAELKMTLGENVKLGSLWSNRTLKIPEKQTDFSALKIKGIRAYQWTKGYLGYDPPQTISNPTGFIKQLYLGSYRLSLFERKGKNKNIFPDERPFVPKRINLYSEQKETVPLQGGAASLGFHKFDFVPFYSKGKYPARLMSLEEKNGRNIPSYRNIEDLLEVEIFGGIGNYKVSSFLNLSSFWIQNKAELNLLGLKSSILKAQIFGGSFKSSFKTIDLQAIFAKTDPPFYHSQKSDFYLLKLNVKPLTKSRFFFSYKRIDPGFMNLAGTVFKGDLWRISSVLTQKIAYGTDLKMSYTQGERIINQLLFPAHRLQIQIFKKLEEDFSFLTKASYTKNKNIFISKKVDETGAARNFSVKTEDELKTKIALFCDFSEKLTAGFDFQLARGVQPDEQSLTRISQALGSSIGYSFFDNLWCGVGFNYFDGNIQKSNNEIQTLKLELSSFWKNFKIKAKIQNRFTFKKETIEISEWEEEEINQPRNQNKLTLQIFYYW